VNKNEPIDRITEVLDTHSQDSTDNRVTEPLLKSEKKVISDRSRVTEPIKTNSGTSSRTKVDFGDIIGSGYKIGEILSENSGESDVHLCEKDNKTYVAKIYKQSHKINADIIAKLNQIDSEYILKSIESGIHNGRYYEILPYFRNGTLFDNLKSFSDKFIKDVLVFEVNEALKAIHEQEIVHDDIKPHNIFLTDDFKHIVIGDFGISRDMQGRSYITKASSAITLMYAAPEADESVSKMGDYYSFGMTLLHMGFRDDPFKGITNHKVRMLQMNYKTEIPNEINPDLADLIHELIRFAPYERLDYIGVSKWIKNHKIYQGCRLKQEEKDPNSMYLIEDYQFKVKGENKIFSDSKSLTEAMIDEWSEALKHYENNLINEAIKAHNQSFYLELKDVFAKYLKTPEIGLFITLNMINPKLPFTYRDKKYGNFKNFIEAMIKMYPNAEMPALSLDILLLVAKNEGLDNKVQETIKEIFQSYPEHSWETYDMLLNLFKSSEEVFHRGVKYKNLADFMNVLFDGLEVKPLTIESNQKLFYSFLVNQYGIEKKKIDVIKKKEDIVDRYCSLSKLILGHLCFSFNASPVRNLHDFIVQVGIAYESQNPEYIEALSSFIQTGKLKIINDLEEHPNNELISQIYKLKDKKEMFYKAYFLTSTKSNFKGCTTLSSLSTLVLSSADPDKLAQEILKDPLFSMWLNSKGYKVK